MDIRGGILEVLTEEQVRDIHLASLEILERTGVEVPDRGLLDLCHESSANVDFEKGRVRFPAWLVEEQVQKAPSRFTWYGRSSDRKIRMEGTRVHFGAASSALFTIGLDGVRRPTTLADAGNFARLVDGLDNIHDGWCVVHPRDVPDWAAHAHMMLAIMRNTEKPFKGRVYGADQAKDCIQMAEILAGGSEQMRRRPNLLTNVNPVSPLMHGDDLLAGTKEYLKRGLPIIFSSEIQAGATGPVTLAGTLVQHNAEVLSAIVMAQLMSPGNPVVYGMVSSIMDMRRGTIAYAAMEAALLNAAAAQIARFYGLPCRGTAGFSDANLLDMQTGFESGMTVLMAALAGVNFILGSAGAIESTLTASFEKLVIDEAMLGMVVRALQGIEVNDGTLAVDLIDQVGPGGNYLVEDNTLQYLKKEHYLPDLIARVNRDIFEMEGRRGIRDLARAKAEKILSEHHPSPLDEGVERELEKVVKAAEERGPAK